MWLINQPVLQNTSTLKMAKSSTAKRWYPHLLHGRERKQANIQDWRLEMSFMCTDVVQDLSSTHWPVAWVLREWSINPLRMKKKKVEVVSYPVFPDFPRALLFGRFPGFVRLSVLLVRATCRWRLVWSIGGMVLTGVNRSTGRKTCYRVGDRWMNDYGAMVEW